MADLAQLLERVEALQAAGELGAVRDGLEEGAGEVAEAVRMVVTDRDLRPEHRARVYEDLLANRELLEGDADPRVVCLMVWSEHVERLYKALRDGRLGTFHYTRALEATCRRAGFELLPAMGRIEELGKVWAGRRYGETLGILAPA